MGKIIKVLQDRLESRKPWSTGRNPSSLHSVLPESPFSQHCLPLDTTPTRPHVHSRLRLRQHEPKAESGCGTAGLAPTCPPAHRWPLQPNCALQPTPHQSLLLQQKISLLLFFPVLILQVLQPRVAEGGRKS